MLVEGVNAATAVPVPPPAAPPAQETQTAQLQEVDPRDRIGELNPQPAPAGGLDANPFDREEEGDIMQQIGIGARFDFRA